jgi:hypothetical protein
MKFLGKNAWIIWLLVLLLLILLIILFLRCCHCKTTDSGSSHHFSGDTTHWDSTRRQIIVWKNPDVSNETFQTWLNRFKDSIRQLGRIADSSFCSSCDSALLLLKGPGPSLLIQQSTAGGNGGSGNGSGVGGGNGPGYYCANFDFDLADKSDTGTPHVPDRILHLPTPIKGATVLVAVFDTGLWPDGRNFLTKGVNTCLPDPKSAKGWNFVSNTPNTNDDNQELHGSKVTQFIMDQVREYRSGKVSILPVKVFDNTGKGKLYNILCGLAYAANAKADIIQASFGFYYYSDTNWIYAKAAVTLFAKYIHHYINDNGILMVAAAGNDNLTEDKLYKTAIGVPSANPRNLDSNMFYPASFSAYNKNIISVTTIGHTPPSVSPLQNHSKKRVDIGVYCDTIINGSYDFLNPLPPRGLSSDQIIPSATGSSFAAPIVTGKICAFYGTVPRSLWSDKYAIFNSLLRQPMPSLSTTSPTIVSLNPALVDSVAEGKTMYK